MSQNTYGAHPYASRPTTLTPDQQRTWAVVVHVATGAATLLSAGFLGFLAALGVFLVYKDRGAFVRRAAANAVNIQLNGLLWAIVLGVLGILTFGLGWFLLGVVPIVMVVLHALAAIHAARGDQADPPSTLRFVG
ncbi:MAG: DUF4870 domain-containing protein [Nocardioidaceae bacterium]|nr:DUF4870 domain-containing protein [Nocardioidaceae bacterium]MCL2612473.1 DUF4870 domain-containing protein [Nocardioidaceae bacterium]